MKEKCASCPFRADGNADLASMVMQRTALGASQICHHPRLKGKRETHLCRGARDIQLRTLVAIGLLKEPTDEAFTAESKRLGVL